MRRHPYTDVAIVGTYNTRQARVIEGATPVGLTLEAILGVLARSGVDRSDVEGIASPIAPELMYHMGLGPIWWSEASAGIHGVLDAAHAITAGLAHTVIVTGAGAATYAERDATAPWTRPTNEFVVGVGMYTAVEFALIARHHMERYGTKAEQMAKVAAIIRNNGHVNPEAVFYQRGPYSAEDILASKMIADPFHLLDCSITSEGGGAILMTTPERARDLVERPIFLLGAGMDRMGPVYSSPPAWDLTNSGGDGVPNGYVGRRAAQHSFATAGLTPADVDVIEFYDPFSFEVIRKLEAFGFCGEGEGGEFVDDGNVGPGGRYPINTDGGLLSFSHGGAGAQGLQRVIRAVEQLQGTCATGQVSGAEVALCDNNGAGALMDDVLLLGTHRP